MCWNRKGAAWLLAVLMVWTAMPVFACLSPGMARHACCRGMARECAAMSGQSACCQVRPQNPAAAPALLSNFNQAQSVAALSPHLVPALSFATEHGFPAMLEAPPPHFSPGAATTLRI